MRMKQWCFWLLLGLAFLGLAAIGFAPYLYFGNSTKAGTFGDSFGFINAFISGLAFIGVIIALILQTRELEATTKANEKQLSIAQKTARIQALTYLAEWHYRMMRETQGEVQNTNKTKCEYYGARAVALIPAYSQVRSCPSHLHSCRLIHSPPQELPTLEMHCV